MIEDAAIIGAAVVELAAREVDLSERTEVLSEADFLEIGIHEVVVRVNAISLKIGTVKNAKNVPNLISSLGLSQPPSLEKVPPRRPPANKQNLALPKRM